MLPVIKKINEVLALPVGQFVTDSFEPHTTNVAKQLVKPGTVCYDVGANEGWYTTLFALLAGPNGLGGEVVAFEPMTGRAIEKLIGELKLNPQAAPIQLVECALSDTYVGDVHVNRVRSDAWTLQHCAPGTNGGTDVHYTSMDALVEELGLPAPQVIKIDVDGDEPKVLRGAARTLQAHRPYIVLEVAPDFNQLQNEDIGQALRWLTDTLGYTLHADNDGRQLSPEDAIAAVCAWSSINVICRPGG